VKKPKFHFSHFPWYPIALSTFPVLTLLAHNVGPVRLSVAARPLLVSVCGAALVFLLLRLALRDWQRAAFALTLFLLLFFSYGHVYSLLAKKWNFERLTAVMLSACLVFAVLTLWWATRKPLQFTKGVIFMNILSITMLIYPTYSVVYFSVPKWSSGNFIRDSIPLPGTKAAAVQPLPDIYYIIPDMYTRADLLKDVYKYDNSEFLASLKQMGFYVADCSQSNYIRTEPSLASSLNMNYLQDMGADFAPDSINRFPMWRLIEHSAVRLILESAGYKTVAFATGFSWSEIDDADVYLAPSPLESEMTEFEALLIQTTLARHLEDVGLLDAEQIAGDRYRQRTLFVFDSFDDLARMPGPKFVFMHIIAPHPPFVLGPHGEPLDPGSFLDEKGGYPANKFMEGYRNEVTFVNDQLLAALERLIAESPVPPVIVIQGDHGPWMQPKNKQFYILNAYYLPGHSDALYAEISPVNTFRVILNSYLGADYQLLKDVSYYSPVPNIYDFTAIPRSCGR